MSGEDAFGRGGLHELAVAVARVMGGGAPSPFWTFLRVYVYMYVRVCECVCVLLCVYFVCVHAKP